MNETIYPKLKTREPTNRSEAVARIEELVTLASDSPDAMRANEYLRKADTYRMALIRGVFDY
jgi:hypothetical protein